MPKPIFFRVDRHPVALQFPLEFDPAFYRSQYQDLGQRDDATLKLHYENFGRREGRKASAACDRTGFINLFNEIRPILELGPFDRPLVQGDDVAYFDVLDQKALTERARSRNRHGTVPTIDFISPSGDLSVVDKKFRAICSAHCIEHQPDLISHLNAVENILDDDGLYFVIAPDKRFCFDYFIDESSIPDALDAFSEKRKVHSLSNVVKQMAYTTHNRSLDHWAGKHGGKREGEALMSVIREARRMHDQSNGGYIDVHAWRFTPQSFRYLISALHALGLTRMAAVRVYDTPKPMNEFTAILQKKGTT